MSHVKLIVLTWALFTIIAVLTTLHTDRSARAFDRCVVPPDTIPGLPEPRFFLDQDSYAWLAHTRDLLATGGWRLRHTQMDNAPDGRAMHWSHALMWPLHGMARLIMSHTGWPAARAVELAGVWLMPAMLLLLLCLIFPFLATKLGWIPAALFCSSFLSIHGLSGAFYPLQPDHHGIQMFAVIGMFACLQLGGLGSIQTTNVTRLWGTHGFHRLLPPSFGEARGWFLASAAFGSLAIWLGATIWLFALAILLIAVMCGLFTLAKTLTPDIVFEPSLWRLWARTGILLSAGFYLLEYAPEFPGMRLEINHPIYWLCWWGAGEVLYAITAKPNWRQWLLPSPGGYLLPIAGGLALLAAPTLIFLGPVEWHSIRDPLMNRLHAQFIEEFRSAWPVLQAAPLAFFAHNFGILPLLAGVAFIYGLLFRKEISSQIACFLLPAFLFSLLFFFLMLWQLRWGYFAAGAMAWFITIWLPQVYHHKTVGRYWAEGIAGFLALSMVLAIGWRWHSERLAATADHVPQKWITSSLGKRTALRLGMAARPNQWTMVGMPSEAPALYYFAGIRSLASYYWENVEGWHAETALFTDHPTAERALAIVMDRSVTHIYARPDPMQVILYNWMANPIPRPLDLWQQTTLAGHLMQAADAEVPPWIQFEPDLSALTQRMIVFQTSDGLVGEPITGHIFALHPHGMGENE
jgi:hypothetical protein